MTTGYLYRHVRLDTNEVFYIGIGIHRKYGHRYSRAYNSYKRSVFWKNVIKNTPFEVEILMDELSKDELFKKEKEFIKLYGRKDLNEGTLVNLTNGGEGTSGRRIIGRRMKEEQRLSMIGKKLSQETKDKIAAAHRGKKLSPEHVEKIRSSNIGRKNIVSYKPVLQKTINGEIVKKWESVASTKEGGFTPKQVGNVCRGCTNSHKGYKWEFLPSDSFSK